MKTFLLLIILYSTIDLYNSKLIGLWSKIPIQSSSEKTPNILNFKKDGSLIEINSKGTISHKYNVNNDFIEIIKLNGGSSEYNYYLSEDTLIIQRLENGKFIKASSLISEMVQKNDFDEFLTIPAYKQL